MKTLITSTTSHLFSSTSSLQPFLHSPRNNYNSQQSLNLVYFYTLRMETANLRVTEWLRLEVTSGTDCPGPCPGTF